MCVLCFSVAPSCLPRAPDIYMGGSSIESVPARALGVRLCRKVVTLRLISFDFKDISMVGNSTNVKRKCSGSFVESNMLGFHSEGRCCVNVRRRDHIFHAQVRRSSSLAKSPAQCFGNIPRQRWQLAWGLLSTYYLLRMLVAYTRTHFGLN